jgi:phospholipid/cholesterol/gamma-HCH transport system ATP-binding protein
LIDGQDIVPLAERELQAVRAKFGMVFQYSALLDSLSVLDNVALPLREHTRLSAREVEQKVKQLLSELEISGTETRFPAELSGGMRKRVALARALIREPKIVIYDEPASGLDPITARLVDDLILRTRDRFGVTSLVISHDMAQAMHIADRLYLLERGQIVADGPPRDLVTEHDSLAARFLQASGVSLPALSQPASVP